jgi:hypothetical protein
MELAALLAFIEANGTIFLAAWLLLEQIIAANPKWKSNSTLQMIINAGKKVLGKYQKKA